MWRMIGRLIWVPISAIIGLLVGMFVMVTLGLERFVRDRAETGGGSGFENETLDQLSGWYEQGEFLLTTFQGMSLLTPILLIIVGEVAKLRSSLYYVVGGGVAAVAGPILTQVMATGGDFTMPTSTFLSVLATAGFTGGFVYWLLAGRNA